VVEHRGGDGERAETGARPLGSSTVRTRELTTSNGTGNSGFTICAASTSCRLMPGTAPLTSWIAEPLMYSGAKKGRPIT
jgi:hypothetical protein